LRAKEPLNIDAAQACCVDAAAMALRADVADQVSCRRSVTVHVAIETGHTLHAERLRSFAIGSGIELLLRKLGDQQAEPFQILGVEYAREEFLEILDGH